MKTFRLARGLFYDVIAAPSREAAQELARVERGRDGPLVEILTPDTWTARAVEAATAPSVIDTVPRWVAEGPDGREQELDLDDLPRTTDAQRVQLRGDSPIHAAWLDAILATEAGGAALRKLVVDVAIERNPEAHARKARALAAAYGLGPVPPWHAAILPALVALDVEVERRTSIVMPADWFDADAEALGVHLAWMIDVAERREPMWLSAYRLAFVVQDRSMVRLLIRSIGMLALSSLSWMPPMTLDGARETLAA